MPKRTWDVLNVITLDLAGSEEPEKVEGVVIGEWMTHAGAPDPAIVPRHLRNKVLSWDEAQPYLTGWSASLMPGDGGGSYQIAIWTNRRVLISADMFDGGCGLQEIPRKPEPMEGFEPDPFDTEDN